MAPQAVIDHRAVAASASVAVRLLLRAALAILSLGAGGAIGAFDHTPERIPRPSAGEPKRAFREYTGRDRCRPTLAANLPAVTSPANTPVAHRIKTPIPMRQRSAEFSSLAPPAVVAPLPQFDLAAAIPRMRRYARVLTRDSNRADDLVQDALARAWEKRRLWRPGTDLRAWLFTIMHNVHVNQRALARREAGNVSHDAGGEYRTDWQGAVDGHQLVRVELREVAIAMDRLPPDQREVLLLAAVEELRYDEIAAVLAIPVGTVMSRLSRARERLRRMFSEEPGRRCFKGRGSSPGIGKDASGV